jgi:hypothetical protein
MLVAALPAACGGGSHPDLTLVSNDWVQKLCTAINRDCLQVEDITKSGDGRELRVVFRDELIALSPSGEAHAYPKPATLAWMNDDHEWIGWTNDLTRGFFLKSDAVQTYERGYPKFDSGGRYYAVTEGVTTRLFRIKPLREAATMPLDFVSGVFARPPLVFVAGPDRERHRMHVYTYREGDGGVEFIGVRDIQRPDTSTSPFYLSDVTATGDYFVLHETPDAAGTSPAAVRVYQASAGAFTSIKTDVLPWATLFLSDDLRKRVNGRSARFTLAPAKTADSRR